MLLKVSYEILCCFMLIAVSLLHNRSPIAARAVTGGSGVLRDSSVKVGGEEQRGRALANASDSSRNSKQSQKSRHVRQRHSGSR